ncbi:MAG: hypothetical protein HKN26_09485 [Acidimicrobiales bacterium]|nr:hypothetical protein [Acidimicrobiales bacterium]
MRPTDRRDAVVLTVAMLAASAGNYVLNSALGRLLPAAEFGEAALLVSLVLFSAVVSTALQLGASHAAADGDDLPARVVRTSTRAGLFGAAPFVMVAPLVAPWLHVSTVALVIVGFGWPLHARLAVERGLLQGFDRAGRASATFVVEFVFRLVATLVFVLAGWGVIGVALGLNVGFAGGLIVTGLTSPGRFAPIAGGRGDRPATARFLMLTAATAVVSYADIVIAKVVLEPEAAGRYAAVALIGRATAVVALSMQQIVVPLVRRSGREAHARMLAWTAGVTGALAASAFLVATIADELIIRLAFGSSYVSIASILGPYTFATGCFAVVTVVVSADLAAGRLRSLGVVMAGAVAQTVVLSSFASTATGMVTGQVVVMTALLFALAVVRHDRVVVSLTWKSRVRADRAPMGVRS